MEGPITGPAPEFRSTYKPPRYELQFSYGDQEILLSINEELSPTELDQAVKAWLEAIDKLIVR